MAPPEDQEMARSMVEHESALLEMTRREIAGMGDRSPEPVVALLKFPVPTPRNPVAPGNGSIEMAADLGCALDLVRPRTLAGLADRSRRNPVERNLESILLLAPHRFSSPRFPYQFPRE